MSQFEDWVRKAKRKSVVDEGLLTEKLMLDRTAIEKLIPHRGSFLLLDEVTATSSDCNLAIGHRTLVPSDPVFADHFPGDPVYPGVLLVEMMGQLGLVLAQIRNKKPATSNKDISVRFIRLHDARFIEPTLPGDLLALTTEVIEDNGFTLLAGGQVIRANKVVATAVFEAMTFGEDE